MDVSVTLSAKDRKSLLSCLRGSMPARLARRAHILLLRANGWSYRQIREALFVSFSLIRECLRNFQKQGLSSVMVVSKTPEELTTRHRMLADLVTHHQPVDFGYRRTRWSCETLAHVISWESPLRLSAETVRRMLHRLGFRWRRPKPVVGLTDPDYEAKLRRIQAAVSHIRSDETVVFQDEMDIHLNPKIGSMWMRRGEQRTVSTPGNNRKRYLAGSLHLRTGRVIRLVVGGKRDSELFLNHLRALQRSLRRFRVIHVILDNARFHMSKSVRQFLAKPGCRMRLHFLPTYAPETNPIERVWWHLHEAVTRNHRRSTIEELVNDVFSWLREKRLFKIESSLYPSPA